MFLKDAKTIISLSYDCYYILQYTNTIKTSFGILVEPELY